MRLAPVSASSENTSTCTSSDVPNVHVTCAFSTMRSPTLMGCRNTRSSTAAVTTRLRAWRNDAAPRDVDEVHHGSAEDETERISVVWQDDLHHLCADLEARLGCMEGL